MILCDECDRAYHLFCLTPPLEDVPRGSWICDGCILSTGTEFGFDTGREHSLDTYRKAADEFKRRWLAEHSSRSAQPDQTTWPQLRWDNPQHWKTMLEEEDAVEREFWQAVTSPGLAVEVEYGADLHSAKYGRLVNCSQQFQPH